MFANRFRSVARLAAPVSRMHAAVAQQALFQAQSASMLSMQMRTFASFDQIEKSAQKLNKALESEIKYENENYSQLEDIETFLNESGFQFKEQDAGINMVLSKEVGDKIIEVHFEARQPLPDDMPEQEGQEEDMEAPSENYCDFTIYIKDTTGKKGMVVEATSMDTEIAFNNVLVADDMDAIMKMQRFERSMNEYNGPDFTTLDERIQTSLSEFLEGYGVNEHMAAFVECMSLDKDQRLYMRWLSSVKSFIQN